MEPVIKLKQKTIKLSIREDRAILIICIGIALIFWVLVKLSKVYTTEKQVSLSFVLPEDKTYSLVPPSDLMATIEGTGWNLMRSHFNDKTIKITYDLSNGKDLQLNRGQLRSDLANSLFTNAIEIKDINYEGLYVPLDEKIEKKVPIQLNYRFGYAPEHQLKDSLILNPDTVILTGPATLLASIDQWQTDSLILNDLKSSQLLNISLIKPAPEIQLQPIETIVNIPVEQYTENAFFIPLEVVNPPDSFRIFPEVVRLNYVVGLSKFNNVKKEDFQLIVDLKDLSFDKDKSTAPIKLVKQSTDAFNIHFTPQSAQFFIVEVEKEETTKEQQ